MAHLLMAKYSPVARTQRNARIAKALFILSNPDQFLFKTWCSYGRHAPLVPGREIKFRKAAARKGIFTVLRSVLVILRPGGRRRFCFERGGSQGPPAWSGSFRSSSYRRSGSAIPKPPDR